MDHFFVPMNRIWIKALLTINLILNKGFHVLMSRVADKNGIRSTRDQAKQLQITIKYNLIAFLY
jgi:hypothetical protein